jgi:Domain of unknown function (DUF4389)
MPNGEDSQPGPVSPEGSGTPPPGGPEPIPPSPIPPTSPSATPPPPAAWPSQAPWASVPAVTPPTTDLSGRYPIDIDVEVPDRIARWRPLVQWILALPLFIIVYVLRIVAQLCAFVGWFVALFTGQLPEGLGNVIAGYYRYYWRALSYSSFLREKYPPLAPAMGYPDPGDDPARFEVRRGEKLSRLAVLFRIILVIPQLIVLLFLGIALYLVMIVAFFVVLFAGRWPPGLRDFVVGANRWFLRVDAWYSLLADPYPPFSLA